MKKFFAFVLVMAMSTVVFASAANPVVSLVIPGETAVDGIYTLPAGVYDVELVVGRNAYMYGETPYPAFDGYQVSSIAASMETTNCSLQITDDGLPFTTDVIMYGDGVAPGANNSLSLIQAVSLSDMGPDFVIAYNFQVVYDGVGTAVVDLGLVGTSQYRAAAASTGAGYEGMIEASLGDLVIVPEPMTMSLLGLGGLVAVRRRRA